MNCAWSAEVKNTLQTITSTHRTQMTGECERWPLLNPLRCSAEWRVNSCARQRGTRKTSSPLSVIINSVHLRRLSSIMEHKVPVLWPCIQGAVNYLVPDCQTAVIRLSFGLIIQKEVKAHNLGYLTRGQGHPWTRAGIRGCTTDPHRRKPSNILWQTFTSTFETNWQNACAADAHLLQSII